MAKVKKICTQTEIIKQGNSHCVRISKFAMDYMGFELGDTVMITLAKPKKERIPKILLDVFKNSIKEIKSFSNKELNNCFFYLGAEKSAVDGLKKLEKEKVSKAFEKTIELSKGKNFLKKYKIFKKGMAQKSMVKKMAVEIKKTKNKKLLEFLDFYYLSKGKK